MTEFLTGSQFFFLTLTLAAFSFGSFLNRKTHLAIFNPILIAAGIIIALLLALDIPNEAYQTGNRVLTFLLTPATICLSLSLYEQFQDMKKHMGAILLGLTTGTLGCLGCIWLLGRLFGFERVLIITVLPKSITTAIGVSLSEELGGIAAITSACIVITGILANMAGPAFCKLFRIRDSIAQGVAFGTAGHVIGTSRAAQISELTGAVSSFSLTITGILTTVLLSFLAQFL